MNRRSLILVAVLLFPVLVHFAGMATSVLLQTPDAINFNVWDFALLAFVVAYLVLCIYLSHRPALAARVALLVYAFLIPLCLAEIVMALGEPKANLPLVPMHHVTHPGPHLPGCKSPANWTVNRYGVRGPDASAADFANAILCVGGSTTECFYVDDQDTWPWQLQTRLEQLTGQPVYVGNAGKAAHNVSQHAYLLENYTYASDYNLVVLFVGINDLAVALAMPSYWPNQHDEVFPVARVDYFAEFSRPWPYYRNLAIARRLKRAIHAKKPSLSARAIVQDDRAEEVKGARLARQEALQKHAVDELPDLTERFADYRFHLKRAITACRSRGQKIVVMTQPTTYQKDTPPELESLFWITFTGNDDSAYTSAALAEGMRRLNEVTKEVCAEEKVPCLDLAPLVPKDTTAFYDHCHLNNHGCKIVADALADFLVKTAR